MIPTGRAQFIQLLNSSARDGTLLKLTLAKPSGGDPTLENLFVRPVVLQAGPRLAFVWHHATRDVTKNHEIEAALLLLEPLIGTDFLDAHLFTNSTNAQLETSDGKARLRLLPSNRVTAVPAGNDRLKSRPIPPATPWLFAVGITDRRGVPLAPMTDKFRQIQKFAEILGHLVKDAPLPVDRLLRVFDMGCGKGYLTFATSELLGERAEVCGIEARAELVEFCNRTAHEYGFGSRLSFREGSIATLEVGAVDVLIALHACDTATDDALAAGIFGKAVLLVVAPCCQKEIRPQLVPPPVLRAALKHGIFEERQAEFITDALRALLLEWAGYRTRVVEFISTEHTAKNTMITAVKVRPSGDPSLASAIQAFAAFYGVRRHALAAHLGFKFQ